MDKKDNKYLYILTIVLAVAVVGLSVAYAALSSTLTAQFSTVTQSGGSWDVHFVTSGTPVNGTASSTEGSSTDTITCGQATVSNSSVTIGNTTLSKPGDTCTYALQVKNYGSLAARLSEIEWPNKPNASCTTSGAQMVCGDITFKIATAATGTPLLTTNSILSDSGKSGDTQDMWLVLTYSGANVGTGADLNNAKFTLLYVQN